MCHSNNGTTRLFICLKLVKAVSLRMFEQHLIDDTTSRVKTEAVDKNVRAQMIKKTEKITYPLK